MRNNFRSTVRIAAHIALTASLAGGIAACGFTKYPDTVSTGPTTTATTPGSTNPGGTGTGSTTGTGGTTTGTGGGTTAGTATFTQVYQQIISPKCLGCHGSNGSPSFAAYSDFANNTTYVVAGNPSQSRFYSVLASGSMPQGGTKLTSTELALVSSWITAGAQND